MTQAMRTAILNHATLGAGAASVARNLIHALGRVRPQDSYLITLQGNTGGLEDVCRRVPNATVVLAGPWRWRAQRLWWETFALPRLLRSFRAGVILDLCGKGMVRPPCPQAVLLQRPGLFYPGRHYARDTLVMKAVTWWHRRHLRRVLPAVDLLLCQTPVAAERIQERYRHRGQIRICPNAVSRFTLAGDAEQALPAPLAPHAAKFRLFCLTRYYAHKNLEAVADLFERFPEELAGVIVVLTIAGDQHPGAARLLRRIHRRGLADRIVNVGPLRQEDLAGYYKNCQAMFLPTLMESFTGTYLEAMHFGVPILTSDLDFAHVVCQDAAVYFDPWRPLSIKDAILRLKGDEALRRRLVVRGRELLETMYRSWDDVAAELAAELQEIVCPWIEERPSGAQGTQDAG